MALTQHTGKGMTISVGTHDQTGLTKVSVEDAAKPPVERLDKTHSESTAYEFMDDPLGPKGDPKSTVVVMAWDSIIGISENQAHHHTMGAAVACDFATSATPGDDNYSHAGMRLQKRTTTVSYDALATVETTFEALTLGTWGTVT